MITDHEWNMITKKAFPGKPEKAPPFLWTKLLARIEAEETRRSSTWWVQWRWMSQLTVATGVLVSLGAFYLIHNSILPLGAALDGQSDQHLALQIANMDLRTSDDTAAMVLGLDS
jgi:hypothetical protein